MKKIEIEKLLRVMEKLRDPEKGCPWDIKQTMDYVRQFSFSHGLFGAGASSPDFVGIEFPDGSVLGDSGNIKLRFVDRYMKMASEGKL